MMPTKDTPADEGGGGGGGEGFNLLLHNMWNLLTRDNLLIIHAFLMCVIPLNGPLFGDSV